MMKIWLTVVWSVAALLVWGDVCPMKMAIGFILAGQAWQFLRDRDD